MSRIALITGAAGGIGRAAVQEFLKLGWDVFALDRALPGTALPAAAQFVQADVSAVDDVEAVAATLSDRVTALHALVNNAAVQVVRPLVETTLEEWDMVMATNLRAAFVAVKALYPLLRAARGAAVINVSSVHALQTSPNISAYAASKGGLLALTRAMAIELAPDDIRVNALLPGAVDTPMLRAGLHRTKDAGRAAQDRLADLARKTVDGRVGTPEELARAIYFLADSEQSSFMTGQALVVDGGATARLSTE